MASSDSEAGVPLYQQIKSWIRDTIARGEFDPDAPFTTQRELRERFGVSTATAIKALNDLVTDGVLVRHRGRGTFVAPPEQQPNTPRAKDQSIAYITCGHGPGQHSAGIMQGINDACLELGYRVFVTDTAESTDLEAHSIRQAIESGARGVLWYPHDGPGDPELVDELKRHHIPVVFLDRYLPSSVTDSVVADNYAVGYQLTEELVRHEHRRIATLWSEWQCTSVHDRLTGHIQALRDHGLPISAELTALRSYVDQPDSQRQAFLRSLLNGSEPPTVMLCANGFVLALVAHDLVSMGIRIPDDVDVAGMDDAGPFDLMPITSVAAHLPSRQMGETAMRLLARRIGDEELGPAERVVLPITIRTRSSAQVHLRPMTNELTG